MENGAERAEFWKEFILKNARYPAPSRLRSQFDGAKFFDFCRCGCNTFRIEPPEGVKQALIGHAQDLPEGAGASIYEADFELTDGRTIEIILFADRNGHLSEVEVDCCANSYPVPDEIEINGPPFHTRAAKGLFADIGSS